MLSAHGSPPEVIEAARANGGTVIDAVCPLVTKVHHELKVRANKGYTVLYVGHEGHEEAVGTMAVAPEAVHLIQDARRHRRRGRLAKGPSRLLSQTTLSMDEWQDLREYAEEVFPDIWMPSRSDLCFATTNRQAALREVADGAGAVDRDRFGELVEHRGAHQGRRGRGVPSRAARQRRLRAARRPRAAVVAVTAGASAPESLVNEVLERPQSDVTA